MADLLLLYQRQKKRVLAPEYGGDGGKKVGDCDKFDPPVAAFPAHWAPNDLKIYKGSQFPKDYRGGAFVAFHGSWNRAPGPQGGYNVVFQPLSDGKASGQYIVFADGFAGKYKDPGRATYRPSGLAVGPDGALYITDQQGRAHLARYLCRRSQRERHSGCSCSSNGSQSLAWRTATGGRPSRRGVSCLPCQCHLGRQTSRSRWARDIPWRSRRRDLRRMSRR